MPGTLLKVAAKSVAGPDSAVARAAEYAPPVHTNVSNVERMVSLGVGSALLANGALGRHLNLLSVLAGGYLVYRAATGNCVLCQALGVSEIGGTAPNSVIPAGYGVKVEESVTVNAPPAKVYRRWRDFARLPEFMGHLREVTVTDPTHSRWTARGPLGLSVQWDAEVVTDRPNEVIAWRSLPGSDVDTAGSVHFSPAPGGQGTVVKVSLKYDPPAGQLGRAVAKLFGENPERQVHDDLARFKSLMEAGPTAR